VPGHCQVEGRRVGVSVVGIGLKREFEPSVSATGTAIFVILRDEVI
jgi:hypothetical protein